MNLRMILLLGMLWVGAGARAENWPAWRGPHGNGVVPDREGPTSFAADRMWKVKLEGRACSTPVVWEGKVFVTGLIGKNDGVQAFDLKTGKEVWRKELGAARLGRTTLFQPFLAGLPPLPRAGGKAQDLCLDVALFQCPGQDIGAHGGHGNGPAAHRAGIVDKKCNYSIFEFNFLLVFVRKRTRWINYHS